MVNGERDSLIAGLQAELLAAEESRAYGLKLLTTAEINTILMTL
jgi:hypothetical protein